MHPTSRQTSNISAPFAERVGSNHHSNIACKCSMNDSEPDTIYNTLIHNQIIMTKLSQIHQNEIVESRNIQIGIIFHYIGDISSSVTMELLQERAHEIIIALNEDFNGYANPADPTSSHCKSTARYNSIINRVFFDNIKKQQLYLSESYMRQVMPKYPLGIKFFLGSIYTYSTGRAISFPVGSSYYLGRTIIKESIAEFGAGAIHSKEMLNVWIYEGGANSLTYTYAPWETPCEILPYYWGVYVSKSLFFPELTRTRERQITIQTTTFKGITHAFGHYFGLLHKPLSSKPESTTVCPNINIANEVSIYQTQAARRATRTEDVDICKILPELFLNPSYNPDFTNFMNESIDKNMCHFDPDQMYKMKFFILFYYPTFCKRPSHVPDGILY